MHALQLLEQEQTVHLVRRVHEAVQQKEGEEVFILEEGRTCTGLRVFTALKLASRPPRSALESGIWRFGAHFQSDSRCHGWLALKFFSLACSGLAHCLSCAAYSQCLAE